MFVRNQSFIARAKSFKKSDEQLISEIIHDAEEVEKVKVNRFKRDEVYKTSSWLFCYVHFISKAAEVIVHGYFKNYFSGFITIVVVIAAATAGIETYPNMGANADEFFYILNRVIAVIFLTEVALKIAAEGSNPINYFIGHSGRLNCMDFIISFLTAPFIADPLFGENNDISQFTRVLRILRLVKVSNRIPAFGVIVSGMLGGMRSVSYIAMLMLTLIYLYALVGVNIFRQNNPFYFRDIPTAMITLFQAMTLDSWTDNLRIDAYGCDYYPAGIYAVESQWADNSTWSLVPNMFRCSNPYTQPMASTLFWISYITISALILLSLFIGIITMSIDESLTAMRLQIEENKRIKTLRMTSKILRRLDNLAATSHETNMDESFRLRLFGKFKSLLTKFGKFLLRDKQSTKNTRQIQTTLWEGWTGVSLVDPSEVSPPSRIISPSTFLPIRKLALYLQSVLDHFVTNLFLLVVIVLSAALVGIETDYDSPDKSNAYLILDSTISAIFLLELLARIAAEEFNLFLYFKNRWNTFDFTIILLSQLPLDTSLALALRLFRIARIVKIFKSLNGLKIVVNALIAGLNSILYVGAMIIAFFYIAAMLAVIIFSGNDFYRFGSLHVAMLTLFQVSTLDNWGVIMYTQIYGCDVYPLFVTLLDSNVPPNGPPNNVPLNQSQPLNDNTTTYNFMSNIGGNLISSVNSLNNIGTASDNSGPVKRARSCINSSPLGYGAFTFFVIFILVGSFIMLTLFVGVVTAAMGVEIENNAVSEALEKKIEFVARQNQISPTQVNMYRQAFARMDFDNNGTIDKDELRVSLSYLNIVPSREEVEDLIKDIDMDDNGIIDFSEFLTFMVNLKKLYPPVAAHGDDKIQPGHNSTAHMAMRSTHTKMQIHGLIYQRDITGIKEVVSKDRSALRDVDSKGRSPLHIAVMEGGFEIAEWLIQEKVNVNAKDSHWKTCLHYCKCSKSFLDLLCRNGANANLVDRNGMTPLHVYILAYEYECVYAILSYGANPNITDFHDKRSCIHLAAKLADFRILSQLLTKWSKASDLESLDCSGYTALLHVVSSDSTRRDHLECLKLLVECGASPEAVDLLGASALHFACANKNLIENSQAEGVISYLLSQGLSANDPDIHGCTPLILACANNNWEGCKLLLAADGDLNISASRNSKLLQDIDERLNNIDDNDEKSHVELESVNDRFNSVFYNDEECTGNSFIPMNMRVQLYAFISSVQTAIPLESRRHCAECGTYLTDGIKESPVVDYIASYTSLLSINRQTSKRFTDKMACGRCARIVCRQCCNHSVPKALALPHSAASSGLSSLIDLSSSHLNICYPCFLSVNIADIETEIRNL